MAGLGFVVGEESEAGVYFLPLDFIMSAGEARESSWRTRVAQARAVAGRMPSPALHQLL